MNGSVELYKACKKHGIKPILGLEAYFVDDRTVREAQGRAQPPDAARGDRRGLPQPRQALERRASSRACTAASRASTSSCSRATPRASSRSRGCLASRLEPADRRGQARPRRAPTSTTWCRSSGPRTSTSRSSATASPSRSRSTRRSRGSRSEMGRPLVATADVHYLRREDYHHHAALLCVQTKSTLAQPKMSFDTNEFYPEELGGDGGVVRRHARRRSPRRSRSPSAATSTIELGRQLIPRFDCPDGETERGVPARAGRARACAAATATRRPAEARRADGDGARRHRQHGLQRLLPDRLGLRPLRQGQRDRRRPGPRLRGRLDRRLLPADHGRRSARATTCCSSAS